jgi:WD40 repeat protein/DNA-binding SARP family transcriptional activator
LDFRLLGPLEVVGDDGLALSIGTGRQRALLALLVLRANEPVAIDRLVEELWGEAPPPTAQRMLHNQVSALRRVLGRNGRLETHGSAYRLNVRPGERDVDRFEELVVRGRALMEADPEGAAETLGRALDLWRGAPLADLAYEPFAQTEIARLEERRWAAFEARVEAELALARHADLVSELEAAVAQQPLREHLHGRLMLALYRCGRQAEALEAYRTARRTLVAEIGVEPGAELRELQDAILAQDPALDAPPGKGELPSALEGGSPLLAGRDREFAQLVALLADACEGRGGVVLLSGPRGIGKTRLAVELAREALRRRAAVLYARAGTPPGDALAAVRSGRPTLLIVDDADEASADALRRTAAVGAETPRSRLLLLVLHRGREPPAALGAQPTRRLELGPLDHESVAEIARLYLDAGIESPPVERLAAESGGVPLAVHRVAAGWARAQASEAVGQSAGRAAVERGELREAETDLWGDVLALRAVDGRSRRYRSGEERTPLPAVCPFVGLATFDAVHAEYFFGRERLVAELVARLVGSPLLAVVGPSGSGKSSAVRAGLLPALASGVLPGSERWCQVLIRPGEHPMAELDRVLSPLDERALLVVDQFEELFTVCRDEDERTRFLDALVELAEDRDRRIQVVVAMRADFYGRCAVHGRLARLVGANQVLVGPMRRDELRRAIEEPAGCVGLRVERSLTDALIVDVLDQPGGLPLLSAALLEQWREREGGVMRHATYEHTGGVQGAVGRLAEKTYTALSEPEREAARRILLRLADADEQESAFVRRRTPLDELGRERDAHTAAALAALIDSRLITADEGTLEVAHEALLREWPRLRAWLEDDAEGRRLHQHLIHAARDWETAGRDRGELYRGARLASALDWVAAHEGDMNELEREFLEHSRAEAERELERQRRVNLRLRGMLAALAGLLLLAVVAGVVALNQRGEARGAALAADAQRLGAEALTQERLDRALLLARTGVTLDDTPATRGNLLSVLMRSPAALGVLDYGQRLFAAAVSPDGRLMAIGDDRGTVTVYDAASRQRLGRPYRIPQGVIQQLRFSLDGRTLAIGSIDPADELQRAMVDLIDPRTRRLRLRLAGQSRGGVRGSELPAFPERAPFVVANVVFLPDTQDLVVALIHGEFPDASASLLYRVDGETGAIESELRVGRHSALLPSATADGERLFLTSARDNRTWEIDPDGLRMRRSYPVGDFAGAVSPDGSVFALGSQTGRVRLLDLRSGQVRSFRGRHDGSVLRAIFTHDGDTLVTSGNDGRVIAWDVARRAVAQRFAGHSGEVWGLDVTADGRTLVTSAADGRAIVWDLAGDRRLDRRFSVGAPLDTSARAAWFVVDVTRGVAVSPDGRTLAVTRSGGAVDLLEAGTLRRSGTVQALPGFAASVAFSPNGRLLAVVGKDGRITLWNARTLRSAGELRGLRADGQALAFSPDGRFLAAAEALFEPPRMRVWDVRRRALTRVRAPTAAATLAFSPDGRLIAVATGNHRGADIRDARSGRLVKSVRTVELARSAAFSPDGDLLVVGLYDGRLEFFSTSGWKGIGQPIEAHSAAITHPVFTPDGGVLATAAADGTVALWDVDTQRPIGTPVAVDPGRATSAAFSPDGSELFAVSTSGQGVRLSTSPEAWKRHACLVAGRDLTAREWGEVLPDRPYQAVCSGD